MNRLHTVIVWAVLTGGLAAAASDPSPLHRPVENLSLDQALEMAERLQPELAVAKAMVDAAEGRARQAGALPNPELIAGAQQIPFRGGGPSEREYVAGVGQTLPMGGRLGQARAVETHGREAQERALDVKRREVRQTVHAAFATALYQDHAYSAQARIVEAAARGVATTEARMQAGDAPREELARAEMELARARIEVGRAETLRQRSLVALASAIGDVDLAVTSLTGSLEAALELPTIEAVAQDLAAHPGSGQAQAEVRASRARVDLAKAERIPDVKVELLYHRLEASRQDTLDIGLSIPLPAFNRNQGRLREARADLAAAEARARLTHNELTTRLRESQGQLSSALASSRAMKSDILPRAETVLKAAEARYEAGDISLADLLPVRRDWAAVQLSYLESLRDVMHAWAEVKTFTGRG